MPVSASTMSRLLGRLTAAMGKPFSDAKVEMQATEYARAMGHLPEFAVEWAVNQAIKDSDRYPKASALRKLALNCPQIGNGNNDQSLGAQMRTWEASPWPAEWPNEEARSACLSLPCPACGSAITPTHRGFVIVHDDQRHRELRISYSNLGKPEWFELGPPVMPLPKKRPKAKPDEAAAPVALGELLPQGIGPPPDDAWDEEQQQLAAANEDAA